MSKKDKFLTAKSFNKQDPQSQMIELEVMFSFVIRRGDMIQNCIISTYQHDSYGYYVDVYKKSESSPSFKIRALETETEIDELITIISIEEKDLI
jgi:hypothetical protein